ncbi:MAG: radical SAM protein [Melioribacteraceae bacterium]|nr:radical SAM protein [Melioribacteraceae bacterium]MCO6472302.1 radical SAM protein [Melioribacteraceae bacterium]MDD3558478.1 radical SAM protein [Melioribacteraceae bacterium]
MIFENKLDKKYDAWIQWNLTSKCNFDCEYCFGHSTEPNQKISPIKINELLKTLSQSKKIFRIGFTGGEPFLIPNFIEAAKRLTEKHFISLNSHFTSSKVQEFLNVVDKEKVLFIHASLHFDELVNKNLFDRYVSNFNEARNSGFNIYAEAVAYPAALKKINENLQMMKLVNIDFTYAPFFGEINRKNYPESYTELEKSMFGLSDDAIQHHFQKGKFCNAGKNVFAAYSTGKVTPCFQIHETVGNLYSGISLSDDGIFCPAKRCGCPLNYYDTYLFKKSLNNGTK